MTKKSALQRTQFIMMFFAFAFGMILSSLLTQYGKQKGETEERKEILFIYRGIEKYLEDLAVEDRKRLTALAHDKQTIVENAALRQYFLDEAHKTKQTVEQLIKTKMPWQEVTEEEISAFYALNQSKLNKPLSEIYQEIRSHLERQRINAAKSALLDELIRQGNLALMPSS